MISSQIRRSSARSTATATRNHSLWSTFSKDRVPRRGLASVPEPRTRAAVQGRQSRNLSSPLLSHMHTPVVSRTMASEANSPKEIYRADYTPPAFAVHSVDLTVSLHDGPGSRTVVTNTMVLAAQHQSQESGGQPLTLHCEDIDVRSVRVNGAAVDGFTVAGDILTVPLPFNGTITPGKAFTVETVSALDPEANTQLSGLYKSSGMFCTQCEAEGFRRITPYFDRPDVMSSFRVRIEADRAAYPQLLSNGNKVDAGELESGRHFAVWEDPFKKPSYLFALVAGDLGSIKDTFTTKSGKRVDLEIFSEHDNVDQLSHAMESLKKSMRWDEDRYGLEYDLGVYNIVAVNDFNMGAMENKGLNIFNTALVLAKPSTATDLDYERIESVVGHEYFHNWTGNRVTCRDWFQLTLKEGLTVYRDQEFSADMNSRAVARINDVKALRGRQFPEDSGPMAHPIRPESYIAMDNFYTATVYEKGAEVIRMYEQILGRDGFRKGMDLYFERHDGQAVTCDDFRRAMGDANGVDLTQFERWYTQAGTPTVTVRCEDGDGGVTVRLSQHTKATPGQSTKQPFHVPFKVAMLDRETGEEVIPETTLSLTENEQTFTLPIAETGSNSSSRRGGSRPLVPSVLRGFSAPVRVEHEPALGDDDLSFLMAHDTDPFNRWESSQLLYTRVLLDYIQTIQSGASPVLPETVSSAFATTLDRGSEHGLSSQAYALSLPTALELMGSLADDTTVDPIAVVDARQQLKQDLGKLFHDSLSEKYQALSTDPASYEFNPEEVGRRALRNLCLSYLSHDGTSPDLAYRQLTLANNMTDRLSALHCMLARDEGCELRGRALRLFYDQARGDPLVVNKWFSAQAAADLPAAVNEVTRLVQHEDFSWTNPNRMRSVVGVFAALNLRGFHAPGGEGYQFVGDAVLKLSTINPQVAARLATSFAHWRKFDDDRQALMRDQLERIAKHEGVSKDVYEIATKSLK